MADTVTVKLRGGPCNGRTEQIDLTTLYRGEVKCGGATYRIERGSYNPVLADFDATSVSGAGIRDAGAMKGWNDLQRVVNNRLPGELVLANRYLRQSLHELRRLRVK